jgi:hypothetical protein
MEMSQLVVFFRGRNTASIMSDANGAEILDPGDRVVVVAREGDELAAPGDVVPAWDGGYGIPLTGYVKVVVIANGGTTAQQVPLIFRLGELEGIAASEARRDWELDREPAPSIRVEVIDLQRGASPIVLVGGSLDSRSDL